MKYTVTLTASLAVLLSFSGSMTPLAVAAADGDARRIMPTDLKPVALAAEERNPFEKRVELKTESDLEEGVELSEEDRVRQKFNELKVRGGTPGQRLLLSDMILEKGRIVDPVLADQTIALIVTDISSNEIELTWKDDVGKKRPRTIVLPYDLTPTVRLRLGGQTYGEGENGESSAVLAERIMTRSARPEMPKVKVVGEDGEIREIDSSQIVGQ